MPNVGHLIRAELLAQQEKHAVDLSEIFQLSLVRHGV
jgi:hypothetical protein